MVAKTGVGDRAVVIPESAVILNIVEDIESLFVVPVVDIIGSRVHISLVVAAHALAVALVVLAAVGAREEIVEEVFPVRVELAAVRSAVTAAGIASSRGTGTSVAAGSGIRVLALVDDLLISFLYELEHLFRLFFIGVIDIGIRVIFLAQRAVCFLDLLVGSIPFNAENFIRVTHPVKSFPRKPAPPFFSCVFLQTYTIFQNTVYFEGYQYFLLREASRRRLCSLRAPL